MFDSYIRLFPPKGQAATDIIVKWLLSGFMVEVMDARTLARYS